jgi:predicted nucleic acid-binding protein
MKTLHLDTNILIALLDPHSASYQQVLKSCEAGLLPATSALAWHEFVRGPISGEQMVLVDAIVGKRIQPMTRSVAELGARLFNATGRRRASTADCLIAACAIENKATLMTLNEEDFTPLEKFGLIINRVKGESS